MAIQDGGKINKNGRCYDMEKVKEAILPSSDNTSEQDVKDKQKFDTISDNLDKMQKALDEHAEKELQCIRNAYVAQANT